MQYQWYPGHMSKAKHQIEADLKLVDVIVEVLDARIPISSRNPDIARLADKKPFLLLLNKSDLADSTETRHFQAFYEKQGYGVIALDGKSGNSMKKILNGIETICKEKREKDKKKGILNRPLKAMVLGIPNVGKSTIINSLAGKNCALTGNKPGVTKGKQWIRLNNNIDLYDSPGILWPKFDDQEIGRKIAMIGSINEDILDLNDLSISLLSFLFHFYPGIINKKYGIEESEDGYEALARIARIRGSLKKGGEPDRDKAAVFVMNDFRNGKLGKITLDRVTEESTNGEGRNDSIDKETV